LPSRDSATPERQGEFILQNMKLIQLTKGKFTMVDDEDFEELNKVKWHCDSVGYASRRLPMALGEKGKLIRMHRYIMNPPKDMQVDHIDRNKLNNQRANLRICTSAENQRNMMSSKSRGASSKYKGVCVAKRIWNGKVRTYFTANIRFNRKTFHLGYFKDETLAALAYNEAAIRFHGEFAALNKIEKSEE